MIKLWKNEPHDWKIEFIFDEKTNVYRKDSLKLRLADDGRCLQINLGKSADVGTLVIKRGIAAAINELRKLGAKSALVCAKNIDKQSASVVSALTLGARLALYEMTTYKKDAVKNTDEFSLYIESGETPEIEAALSEANIVSDGVLLARELVNMPPAKLTPEIMGDEIAAHCAKFGVEVSVLDEKFIEEQKMGALWAVGSSSANMPRIIVMRHMGDPANPNDITAIIGKALTFDSGGYSLKPAAGMKNMKCDMAGGAATFGAVLAMARNKVKANVVAVICAAENRISRESFLPSDVLHTMSGRTVEVLSTDAEGRLCMSDAMTYAIKHEKATRVMDIATLTGAAAQTFGKKTAATMTNNEAFYAEFLKAAKQSGEQFWLMPSHDEYYMMIESKIADLKNATDEGCGIMGAGLFMEHFSEGLPWIHIDIAGVAFCAAPGYEFQKAGGTGAGVETLYAMFAK